MVEEINKLLRINLIIQITFIVIAILSLAFAQAIGAVLSMSAVLSVLGGCFSIEIIVIFAITTYVHYANKTLDDVSDEVRQASAELAKRAKGAVSAASNVVIDNVTKSNEVTERNVRTNQNDTDDNEGNASTDEEELDDGHDRRNTQ